MYFGLKKGVRSVFRSLSSSTKILKFNRLPILKLNTWFEHTALAYASRLFFLVSGLSLNAQWKQVTDSANSEANHQTSATQVVDLQHLQYRVIKMFSRFSRLKEADNSLSIGSVKDKILWSALQRLQAIKLLHL